MPNLTRIAHLLRARMAPLAAMAMLVLMAATVLGAQAYQEPRSERFTAHETRWTEQASFTYHVPVMRNESVWPVGTSLPMGEPAYYRTISPQVPVRFVWTADTDKVDLEGVVHARLSLRVAAETRDARVLWQLERPLDDGFFPRPEAVVLEGVLDLDAIKAEVDAVVAELPPADARLNYSVEALVTYALTRGEADEAGKSLYVLPMRISDPRYELPAAAALAWEKPHGTTRAQVLAREAGWGGVFSSLATLGLAGAGFALLAALAWARQADVTRGLRGADAAFILEQAAHEEWVTATREPLDPQRLAPLVVDVDSLEALVHAAADARTRVLLDTRRRIYYVPLAHLTYRYARHALVPVPSVRPQPTVRAPKT